MRRIIMIAVALVTVATTSNPAVAATSDPANVAIAGSWTMNPSADQWVGLHGLFIGDKGVGLFLEFRTTSTYHSRDNFYDNIDEVLADYWGDPIRETVESDESYGAGLAMRMSRRILAHVGLTYVSNTQFEKRYDSTHLLGDGGEYYIEVDGSKSGMGVTGGITYLAGKRVAIQAGYDSNPSGVVVGFGVFWPPIQPKSPYPPDTKKRSPRTKGTRAW